MQSEFQGNDLPLECFVGAGASHQIQNSLELQIVNDLQETYRLRYKSEYVAATGQIRMPRYVTDRLGNHYVSLKMTPNLQGKIRVDWLTISDKTGQRYVMPYHFLLNNDSIDILDCNPVMYDINTDMNGFMRLYLILAKAKQSELMQRQPLILFQPVMDALHKPSLSCYRQISPRELIQRFQLNKSQLAFTLCTTTDGKSFVPQWYTTIFSTVMREEMVWDLQSRRIYLNHHRRMLSSSTNTHDNYEQESSMGEDTMERRKRQRLDDTRLENMAESQSTTTDVSMVNASLLSLPVELVHCILDHCDVKTIFSMRSVCKQMYAFADTFNRFRLTFNSTSPSTAKSLLRFVLPEKVVSLTISDTHQTDNFRARDGQIDPFYSIFDNLQFMRLRSLTFRTASDTSLKYFVDNFLNTDFLVSLSIKSNEQQHKRTWAFVSSTFSRYSLRKLSVNNMETIMGPISWPNQWKLEHLAIDDCNYNAYLSILQQLPYLRTFSMRDCIINDVDKTVLSSSNNTFTAALESLTITHCSLLTDHLDLLLLFLPSLRQLKLTSHRKVFDSVFDGMYWERLISMKLPKLDKFEFIFFHTYNENDDFINLEDLITPFRSSFWLHDKRWFVAGAYVVKENEIWLHTTPIHFTDIIDLVRLEMSWMDNNFRLTQRPLNKMLDLSSDKTLTVLDLHSNRISGQKLQHLINALYNNTTLVELNLGGIQIGNQRIKDLAHFLQNNRTLTILWLWQNQIGHQGAQYLADVLHNNMILKELYLGNNSIGDQGAQYLAYALQNNTTLTTLDLHANGIGRHGIQDLCNALENNKTLTTLGLGYNQIGDQEAQYLVNVLTNNVTLQHLYLDENSISVEIWNQFQKKGN